MTNRGRFVGDPSLFPERSLQFALGPLEPVALRLRQALAGAVDLEGQHRERGAIGADLAALTAFQCGNPAVPAALTSVADKPHSR